MAFCTWWDGGPFFLNRETYFVVTPPLRPACTDDAPRSIHKQLLSPLVYPEICVPKHVKISYRGV